MSSTDSPAEGVGNAVEAPPGKVVPTSEASAGTGVRAVARSGLLTMIALLVLGLTRLIYSSMVSRATDPETFGLVGALLAVTMIVSLLLPAGVAAATSRFVPFSRGAGDPAAARGLYRALDRLGLAGAVVLSTGAAFATRAVTDGPAGQAVEVGLLTFAYSAYSIDKAALYAFGRVGRYVRLEIAASAVTLAATVVLVLTGGRWFLTPLVIGYGAFVVAARVSLRTDLRGDVTRAGRRDWGAITGYAALACVGTLSSAGFLQGTQLLAARFASSVELAYFVAAVALITPLYFLPRALGLALFPAMSQAHGAGDTATVRNHADLGTRALLAVPAPLFVAAQFIAGEVLFLFGGDAYRPGAPVLQIMLAATYLAVAQVPSVNALSSGSGWQLRTPVLSALCGCLTGLAVVVAVGERWGAAGVGSAYLIGTAVTVTGPVVTVWRRYGMAWAGPLIRGVGVVGAAVGGASALRTADLTGGTRWLVHLGVALLAALVAVAVLAGDLRRVKRGVPRRAKMPGGTTPADHGTTDGRTDPAQRHDPAQRTDPAQRHDDGPGSNDKRGGTVAPEVTGA